MIALVVHGGAWDIPDDLVAGHRAGVLAAVNAGWELLSNGASALDAAVRAAGQVPENPAVSGSEGELAAFCPLACAVDVLQDPGDLRPGEVGGEGEADLLLESLDVA